MSTIVMDPIPRADVAARSAPSAVSWGAILAGGAAATALSLVLFMLGTGLGLASVSPWELGRVDATTFGVTTILWVTLTQLLASGLGGYLAGRLRTKWADVLGDEIYFRDTAHGFLTWCVASLAMAALFASVLGGVAATGIEAGANVAGRLASGAASALGGGIGAAADAAPGQGGGPAGAGGANPLRYFVDSLFRPAPDAGSGASSAPAAAGDSAVASGSAPPSPEQPAADQAAAAVPEVARIFAHAVRTGSLPDDDVEYVGRLIADRTSLSPNEAEQRVRDAFMRLQTTLRDAETAAKQAADDARKASAYATLWLVVSMFVGAFIASWMATYGGRRRDL